MTAVREWLFKEGNLQPIAAGLIAVYIFGAIMGMPGMAMAQDASATPDTMMMGSAALELDAYADMVTAQHHAVYRGGQQRVTQTHYPRGGRL